jgi:acetyl-CoA acetyltransferase
MTAIPPRNAYELVHFTEASFYGRISEIGREFMRTHGIDREQLMDLWQSAHVETVNAPDGTPIQTKFK